MDITAKKQKYQALQSARADLVDAAVFEIGSHLEGLDADVCKEILARVYRQVTGEGMPTVFGHEHEHSIDEQKKKQQETLKTIGKYVLD